MCPVPLPKCLVVFTQGNWAQYTEETVIDISFVEGATTLKRLGRLSSNNRCFHWEKDTETDEAIQTGTNRLKLQMELKGELLSRKKCKTASTTDINENENTQKNLEAASPKNVQSKLTKEEKKRKSIKMDTSPSTDVTMTTGDKKRKSLKSDTPSPKLTSEHKRKMSKSEQSSLENADEKKRKTSRSEMSPPELTPQKRKMTRSRSTRTIQDIWQGSSPDGSDMVDGCIEKPVTAGLFDGKENVPLPSFGGNSSTPSMGLVKMEVESLNEMIRGTVHPINYKRGSHPTHRWGHSLTLIHDNQALLIGGQGDKQQMCKDAVWLFDTDSKKWTSDTPASEGQRPELRMGHSATYDPTVRCVYIYGGSKNKKWFNDVHMLDLDEWKWQLVKASGKAPTRAYHSSTLFRHEMWVFGGIYPRPDPQPDASSAEINIFSPLEESWYTPIVNGTKPAPRSGHSATVIGDQLVIFGGWDFPLCFNDLYILDMSIVEWTKPDCNGTPPSPRSWHSATQLTGDRILFHAGYSGDIALGDTSMFRLDTKTWFTIICDQPMSPRTGHTALCLPYKHENKKKDNVIVFGGGDNEGGYYGNLVELCISFDENISSPKQLDVTMTSLNASVTAANTSLVSVK
ncbi:RING finger protein B-like isoform X2 [Lineus longissimus]